MCRKKTGDSPSFERRYHSRISLKSPTWLELFCSASLGQLGHRRYKTYIKHYKTHIYQRHTPSLGQAIAFYLQFGIPTIYQRHASLTTQCVRLPFGSGFGFNGCFAWHHVSKHHAACRGHSRVPTCSIHQLGREMKRIQCKIDVKDPQHSATLRLWTKGTNSAGLSVACSKTFRGITDITTFLSAE